MNTFVIHPRERVVGARSTSSITPSGWREERGRPWVDGGCGRGGREVITLGREGDGGVAVAFDDEVVEDEAV